MLSPSEAVAARAVGPGRRPAIAGGSAEADDTPLGSRLLQPEVVFVAVVCAVVTVVFGVYPEPLLDVARDAGAALPDLL
jgi:NADH-quinone oxidoreductase subunit N